MFQEIFDVSKVCLSCVMSSIKTYKNKTMDYFQRKSSSKKQDPENFDPDYKYFSHKKQTSEEATTPKTPNGHFPNNSFNEQNKYGK